MKLRELFRATDPAGSPLLVAVDFAQPEAHRHQLYIFWQNKFSPDDFQSLQQDLKQKWIKGEEISFPQPHQKADWNRAKNPNLPSYLNSEKADFILQKADKSGLFLQSAEYKTDLLEGIQAFGEKVNKAQNFVRADWDFYQAFDKMVSDALDRFRDAEAGLSIEGEVLSPADSKDLRAVLGNIRQKIEELRSVVANTQYADISSRLNAWEQEVFPTAESENGFLLALRGEVRESDLGRNQKDELIQKISSLLKQIEQKRDSLRAENKAETAAWLETTNRQLEEMESEVRATRHFADMRKRLIALQTQVKEANAAWNAKKEIFDSIRQLFDLLNERQEADKGRFEEAAENNFSRLNDRMDIGTKTAETTEDFNEAREYLKLIGEDIRENELTSAQRKQLRKRLDDIFDILKKRADEFFEIRRQAREQRKVELDGLKESDPIKWERTLRADLTRLERILAENLRASEREEQMLTNAERDENSKDVAYYKKKVSERESKISSFRKEIEEIEAKLAGA